MISRLLPTSLTGRLVAILVAVVVVSTVLISAVTSLAMRGLLYGQLDDQVNGALQRSIGFYENGFGADLRLQDPDGNGPGPSFQPRGGDGIGTLNARFVGADQQGFVVTTSGGRKTLSTSAMRILESVPADTDTHDVELPGVGSFRVKASADDSRRLVSGMSTRSADDAIETLVQWSVLLALAAVLVAGLAGRFLVRRQLRPLREVAATAHEVTALPLSSGAIGTTVRVPDELTDERTEVGQMGAALNTMLAHVEGALDERHRSEQQVRQFVADASHELRTPLSTIHGYAELSRRTQPMDPAQLSMAMTKVEAEATRMSSLVEDLLLLARLDAGRPLADDEVDLTKLVLETVGDARVVSPDHRWLLDLDDEPVLLPGDELRLHQVVTNLLNNARRHTPPGTAVTVSVRTDGSEAVLTVTDDGLGMTPELVRTAFERFSRGDSSRTRASGGAGLGLSLVQAITSAHGGRVAVESRPGRTRFTVRLPAVALSPVSLSPHR